MPPVEIHVVLHDGTRALLRPLRPDDRWRLAQGMALLSPRTRYLRFHAPVTTLSDAQLDHLTDTDERDHVAWIAVDEDRPADPGIGVARYVRMHEEPDVAEAAVTVIDAYQRRGLGTMLLAVLARSARAAGIHGFRTGVLRENAAMLNLLSELGAHVVHEGDDEIVAQVPIPDPDDLPDTPAGRVLRAVAVGRLRIALSRVIPL